MNATHGATGADHRALLYDDPARFAGAVGAFARDGLRDGARVLAVVAPEKQAWLREELGPDAGAVEALDPASLYARNGPMFRTLTDYLDQHAQRGSGRARVVAERPFDRHAPVEVRGYMRYEAAANVVFGRYAASVLCPYDVRRVPDAVLEDALRTHPETLDCGRTSQNPLFIDPRVFVRRRTSAGPPPANAASQPVETPEDVALARELVRVHGQATRLPAAAVEDLTIAASEMAANALVHGRAPRSVLTYVAEGAFVCCVRDAGPGPPDPLAGYLPPDPDSLSGRGLWLAHQLCDVVEVASDGTGTEVYLRVTAP